MDNVYSLTHTIMNSVEKWGDKKVQKLDEQYTQLDRLDPLDPNVKKEKRKLYHKAFWTGVAEGFVEGMIDDLAVLGLVVLVGSTGKWIKQKAAKKKK